MFYLFKNKNIYVDVRVTTRSSKNEVGTVKNDRLQISVTCIPENNKANSAVIGLLSEKFKISKSEIEIISGEKSRNKKIRIAREIDEKTLQELL